MGRKGNEIGSNQNSSQTCRVVWQGDEDDVPYDEDDDDDDEVRVWAGRSIGRLIWGRDGFCGLPGILVASARKEVGIIDRKTGLISFISFYFGQGGGGGVAWVTVRLVYIWDCFIFKPRAWFHFWLFFGGGVGGVARVTVRLFYFQACIMCIAFTDSVADEIRYWTRCVFFSRDFSVAVLTPIWRFHYWLFWGEAGLLE